ncbi:MAG: hypothetical protein AAFR47_16765 [Pseudomonadota bacterium]
MTHPLQDVALRAAMPTLPRHLERGGDHIALPDWPAVRREVEAMLDQPAPVAPAPSEPSARADPVRLPVPYRGPARHARRAGASALRLWLHARAVWLEEVLRPSTDGP